MQSAASNVAHNDIYFGPSPSSVTGAAVVFSDGTRVETEKYDTLGIRLEQQHSELTVVDLSDQSLREICGKPAVTVVKSTEDEGQVLINPTRHKSFNP